MKSAALGFARRVGAVFGELFFRQRIAARRPARRSPRSLRRASPTPCCTLATWRGCQLAKEVAQDAAVAAELAVIIGRPSQMHSAARCGGLSAPTCPLVHGVIRNAVDADLAVAPGSACRPIRRTDRDLGFRAATRRRDSRASGRRRANRCADRHSRPAPISQDRPAPSSGTCCLSLAGPPARLWSGATSCPCSLPGTTGPWRKAHS